MPAPARDLTPFFAPDRIAIVGAGERATSSGGAVMQMLRQAGYGGRVVPVNPRGGSIFGYEAVTSIAAIEPAVDLAVIVIRPDAILEAVGQAAERDLTIAGPNCAGIVHLDPGKCFAATFLRDLPPGTAAGATYGLAFISQSGALAEEFIDKAKARGLPLTSVVSVGNAVHLGVEDYLGWLDDRPEIGAALLYVESIEDSASADTQQDGHPPRQGRMVRHHGASRGTDVQRRRGNGGGRRTSCALSDSLRCSKIGKVAACDL